MSGKSGQFIFCGGEDTPLKMIGKNKKITLFTTRYFGRSWVRSSCFGSAGKQLGIGLADGDRFEVSLRALCCFTFGVFVILFFSGLLYIAYTWKSSV